MDYGRRPRVSWEVRGIKGRDCYAWFNSEDEAVDDIQRRLNRDPNGRYRICRVEGTTEVEARRRGQVEMRFSPVR